MFDDPFLDDWRLGYRIVAYRGLATAEVVREGRCPRCDDSAWVNVVLPTGERRVGRCRCQKVVDAVARWNAAGVPERYASSTLETYNSRVAGASIGFTLATHWLKSFVPGGKGLVLEGEPGRGKTHLLCGILRDVVFARGLTARFVEFTHLLGDMKESWDKRGGDPVRLSELTRVDVLAIDELGKGRKTEWEMAMIDELVSRSYNQGTTVLGTTNFPSKGGVGSGTLAAGGPEGLRERLGDRVYSRLGEMVQYAVVKGEDYRQRR